MTTPLKTRTVPTTWVLVADRSTARLFSKEDGTEDLLELETLMCDDGTSKQSSTVSDRQGYFKGREGGLEAGDPKTDFAHKTAEVFAAQVVSTLESGRTSNRFGRIVIFAAPLFLGVLRKKLPAPLAKMVTAEVDKDFVKESVSDIRTHLAKL